MPLGTSAGGPDGEERTILIHWNQKVNLAPTWETMMWDTISIDILPNRQMQPPENFDKSILICARSKDGETPPLSLHE